MLNIITSLILVLSINQPFFAQRKGSKIKQLPKCPNLSKTILNETEENNKKVVQIPLYELEETNLPKLPIISQPIVPLPELIICGEGIISSRAIKWVRPSYPTTAKRIRIEGDVRIQIQVDEKGNVSEAKVLSGSPFLQHKALTAARLWKFSPCRIRSSQYSHKNRDYTPIKSYSFIIFRFHL